jgi:hypothetical protein
VLDTMCGNIYREERAVAAAVAADVIGSYTAGVWDFVMPPVLVFNLLKHKRRKEGFILNLLYTKKLALEAAREIVGNGLSTEAALQKADEATGAVLSADTRGIYSDSVRQKQLKEIELLAAHYYGLIISGGKAFEDMLKGAYSGRQAYLEFVDRLNQAEKEVNHTALSTVGKNDSARQFIDKMEKSVEAIRLLDADKYFPVAAVQNQ